MNDMKAGERVIYVGTPEMNASSMFLQFGTVIVTEDNLADVKWDDPTKPTQHWDKDNLRKAPTTLDHGTLSGIRRSSTPRQRRQEAAALDRTIDKAVAELKAAEETERQEAIAAYKAKHAPVPYTSDQLANATHIRTHVGWHKVVRVNQKSVTVETGYSWTDRYTHKQILEVKP